jgi:hypothetical protein
MADLKPIRGKITLDTNPFTKALNASIDKLRNFSKTANTVFKAAERAVRPLIKTLRTLNKAFTKARSGIDKIGKAFFSLKAAIAGAAVAFGGLKIVTLASEVARLDGSFKSLVLTLGVEANQALKRLRKVSKGTISDLELMQNANLSVVLGVAKSIDQLELMVDAARRLGKATGRTAAEGFQDLAIGIGRQSRLVLDNLGIIVKADKAYDDYAESIGVATDDLTELQQKTAFSEAAFKAISRTLDLLGDDVWDFTDAWNSLRAQITNFGTTIVRGLTPQLKEIVNNVEAITKSGSFINTIQKALSVILDYVENITGQLANSPGFLENVEWLIQRLIIGAKVIFDVSSQVFKIITNLLGGLDSAGDQMKVLYDAFIRFFVGLKDIALELAKELVVEVAKLFADIDLPVFGKVFAPLKDIDLGDLGDRVADPLENVVSALRDLTGIDVDEIQELLDDLEGGIAGGRFIADSLTEQQLLSAREQVEGFLDSVKNKAKFTEQQLKFVGLALAKLQAAVDSGFSEQAAQDLLLLMRGQEAFKAQDLLKPQKQDKQEISDTLKNLRRQLQTTMTRLGDSIVDAIIEGRDVAKAAMDSFAEDFRQRLSKEISELAGMMAEKFGGSELTAKVSNAIFAAIGLAATLFGRKSDSSARYTSDDLVSSTQAVRGVVSGPTSISTTEIGESIAEANSTMERLLRDIRDILRTMATDSGVVGVGAAGTI